MPQVHGADLRTLTQYPVVTQNIGDQRGTLYRKILLITLQGVEPGDQGAGTHEHIALRSQVLVQVVVGERASLLAQHPINHIGQGLAAQYLPRLSDQWIIERVAE
ncbi:hypothetical protein D3C84_641560 [compost metagenome]